MVSEYDLFISYSSKDQIVANEIVSKLEAQGLKCWFGPECVPQGQDFQTAIVDAISSVFAVVLVFSKNSDASKHVQREVLLADQAERPVLPLRIENVEPTSGLKYQMAGRQWLDYHTRRNDSIARLVEQHERIKRGEDSNISGDENLPPSGLRRFLPTALEPLYLFFQVRGRIGRRSFWFGLILAFVLLYALLAVTVVALGLAIGFISSNAQAAPGDTQSGNSALYITMAILIFEVLAFLAAFFALIIKRMHDLNASGRWLIPLIATGLLWLVFYIDPSFTKMNFVQLILIVAALGSAIVLLWIGFWPGNARDNGYGPVPRFKRNWQPVLSLLSERAKPRSEYELSFVALSPNGRIGPRGVIVGLGMTVWLVLAGWYLTFWQAQNSVYENANSSVGSPLSALATSFEASGSFLTTLPQGQLFIARRDAASELEAARRQTPASPSIEFLEMQVFMLDRIITNGLFALSAFAFYGFAIFVFICVAAKRLHNASITAWIAPAYMLLFLSICFALEGVLYPLLATSGALVGIATLIFLVVALFAPLLLLPEERDLNEYGPPPGFSIGKLGQSGFRLSSN